MNRNAILLFIIGMIFSRSEACECSLNASKNYAVQEAYNKTEIIVLAKVDSIDNEFIVYSVIEFLKGNLKNRKVKTHINSCSVYARTDEVWLIYLKKINGIYYTDECLPNRNYGIYSNVDKAPPPPPKKGERNLNSSISSYTKHKEILLSYELNGLRQKKILNEMKNLRESYTLIQYGIVIIGILSLLITVLYLIRKMK